MRWYIYHHFIWIFTKKKHHLFCCWNIPQTNHSFNLFCSSHFFISRLFSSHFLILFSSLLFSSLLFYSLLFSSLLIYLHILPYPFSSYVLFSSTSFYCTYLNLTRSKLTNSHTFLPILDGKLPHFKWEILTRGAGSQFIMSVPHGALNFVVTEVDWCLAESPLLFFFLLFSSNMSHCFLSYIFFPFLSYVYFFLNICIFWFFRSWNSLFLYSFYCIYLMICKLTSPFLLPSFSLFSYLCPKSCSLSWFIYLFIYLSLIYLSIYLSIYLYLLFITFLFLFLSSRLQSSNWIR